MIDLTDLLTERPEPSPRCKAVNKWSVSFVSTYIDDRDRAEARQELVRQFAEHPEWACMWASRVLSHMVRALPADDPWRRLYGVMTVGAFHHDAFEDFDDFEAFDPTDGRGSKIVGAWTKHGVEEGTFRRFGTLADHLDICVQRSPDPAADPLLCAVQDPLPEISAFLIAAANRQPGTVCAVLRETFLRARRTRGPVASATVVFRDTLLPALRWVAFRLDRYNTAFATITLAASSGAEFADRFAAMPREDREWTAGDDWGEDPAGPFAGTGDWETPVAEICRPEKGWARLAAITEVAAQSA